MNPVAEYLGNNPLWLVLPWVILIIYIIYVIIKNVKDTFTFVNYFKKRVDYDYLCMEKKIEIIETNIGIIKCMVMENRLLNKKEYLKNNDKIKENFDEYDGIRDKREELEEELIDYKDEFERYKESREELMKEYSIFANVLKRK